jgi:hypothetical protein
MSTEATGDPHTSQKRAPSRRPAPHVPHDMATANRIWAER